MKNGNDIKQNKVIIFKPSTSTNEFKIVLDETNETVWASEQQIVDLFVKSRRTIGAHIQNIYKEKELDIDSTWRKIRQVQKEGSRNIEREVSFYNLDVIIAVGYRVKSPVANEFRKIFKLNLN